MRATKSLLVICLLVTVSLWPKLPLQDVSAGQNPPRSPILDENLMFEFLLGGIRMNRDNNIVLLDEEMASTRPGRALLAQINDNIPRNPSSMMQMVKALKRSRGRPLAQDQFHDLVLSSVYSAYQAQRQEEEEEQQVWAEVLLQLANVTVRELRGRYLHIYPIK
ncbi:protein FAM180B [Synchiropus splendidus]|uniref:protein FAM180B n=1 Tax=Synchiropus splendidus TaxID=270530 RepID=UPI00237D9394|nr:protein FAM180B [Synchiropus splendidus]